MHVVKTKFVDTNPFTGRSVDEFDPDTIVVNKQKPVPPRTNKEYKYDRIFNKLALGDSVTVPQEHSDKTQQALRHYLKRHNKKGIAVARSNDPEPGKATIYRVPK